LRLALAVAALAGHTLPAAGADDDVPLEQLAAKAAAAATSGKSKEAVQLYTRWMERDPMNPLARASLGAALYQDGQWDKARAQLERAVLIEPKLAESWATLGLLYDRAGEDWLAVSAYSRAVHLEPRVARHRILLALSLEKRGWRDAAESCLQEAASLDPRSADAQFNLAALALRRTPPAVETARRHYLSALKLGSTPDPDVEELLGMAKPKAAPTEKPKKAGKKSP
jgi:tetratricopeptide (TPR) repeat protein